MRRGRNQTLANRSLSARGPDRPTGHRLSGRTGTGDTALTLRTYDSTVWSVGNQKHKHERVRGGWAGAREAHTGHARAGPWRDAGRCEGAPVERMRTRRRATHCAEGGGCGFKLRAVTARNLSAVTSRPPVPMITSPRLTSTTRPLHAVKGVSPCVSCGALRWPIGYEEREKPDVGKSQSYVARSRPCEGASPDGGTARGDGGTGQRAPPRELLSQLNTLKSDAHGT